MTKLESAQTKLEIANNLYTASEARCNAALYYIDFVKKFIKATPKRKKEYERYLLKEGES